MDHRQRQALYVKILADVNVLARKQDKVINIISSIDRQNNRTAKLDSRNIPAKVLRRLTRQLGSILTYSLICL
jgi:hypothetical protein